MTTDAPRAQTPEQRSWIGALQRFCLTHKLLVAIFVLGAVVAGILFAPFDWELGTLQRYPIATDAIPDIGENQQIVFSEWPGRSPQDVEDQVGYPLTVSLLGVPGVKSIRSYSFFGFSSIYVIFQEKVDFYWSRARILEKLNSLPAGTLPEGVRPVLGPDATPLGQIFWYTLEGRDPDGNPAGGWDLEELRTLQDWFVRYWLQSADGVAEVASVGGYVREYQVDVDPDALRAYQVSLEEVFQAVQASNIDVGAKTIEINRVEYFVRGVGFIRSISDIEDSVIKVRDHVPVLIRHVGTVSLGPALRRGALDKGGAPAVGGVVVARYGDNPLAVIKNVKRKIRDIQDSLPAKVVIDYGRVRPDGVERYARERGFEPFDGAVLRQEAWLSHLQSIPRTDWPDWAAVSKVAVVPFYDRSGLIYETLGTLNRALIAEILVTVVVVIVMMMHLRSSLLISGMLPLAVLLCFVGMKLFGVDANIVALTGIVIAIGTIVDMGIVMCENILRHLRQAAPEEPRLEVVHRAASEVGGAVFTAVATTVVSFLPVFTMTGAEGKLFKPLAYTKTFALIGSVLIALTVIAPLAHVLFCLRSPARWLRFALSGAVMVLGLLVAWRFAWWFGATVFLMGWFLLVQEYLSRRLRPIGAWLAQALAVVWVGMLLARHWEPLGPSGGPMRNLMFVALLMGGLLFFFRLFQYVYPAVLSWCLRHKVLFLSFPVAIVVLGASIWLGFDRVFGFVPALAEKVKADPQAIRRTTFWVNARQTLPGLGKEFMPPLDEGSFLFMPTTMVHASIGECLDILAQQDKAFDSIPEIESVVGKLGRAETPLDPAPISMFETVIHYRPEYRTDQDGSRLCFRYDRSRGEFVRDAAGELIEDPDGRPYRQWRDHIHGPDDIWQEIVRAARMPGVTLAPKLQPIAARIVMLQSGMRAPMGVKVKGPSLEIIEPVALQIERFLREVPGVEADTVTADRIVGKPYLEIRPDRAALARYGVSIRGFQDVVEIAVGGRTITTTVEQRRRFPVRVRYQRERRDQIDKLAKILVPAADGAQIPLVQVAEIRYVRGPQVIKSEDTFPVGYVVFDKKPDQAEVDLVERCRAYLQAKVDSGELLLPAGVSFSFAGSYENQLRAQKTLSLVLPLALGVIFLIIYFQFRSWAVTLLVFCGIFVAWSGGFLLIGLYGRPWFLDFSLSGVSLRELFQVHPVNLSVAVWVGFLALFGIASDDGVIICSYLQQVFRRQQPDSIAAIRRATLAAGRRRIRPCLMTSATTILALIPVLTSTGRGSDIMVPMAIPSFGGMLVVLISVFVVPVLYCAGKEFQFHAALRRARRSCL
ncbi:MAG: efflux RND transporter permease subunit [Sedimentisphaerales bacterium]|nr:efflux RND transporter permease subunit [Sedimentisphaerales bacterium]